MKVLTMQLNSIIVMDVIAYGGAALGIIVAAHEFNANRVTLPGALCIILLSRISSCRCARWGRTFTLP